jgi:hypothetical protein
MTEQVPMTDPVPTSEHRYERREIIKDAVRGGVGFAFVIVPATFAPHMGVLQSIFIFLAVLFAGYLVRTWARSRTYLRLSENGVEAIGPMGSAIAWSDVTDVTLKYYSTQRDRTGGWVHLVIKGVPTTGRAKISTDSALVEFDVVVAACADAALRNSLAISEATAENFRILGHDVGEVGEPADRDDQADGGDHG